MRRVLIAGCGDVGNRIGVALAKQGHEVFGIRRNVSALAPGIRPVSADLRTGAGFSNIPSACDEVVYAAAGAGREEAAYRQLYVEGLTRTLEHLGDVPRVLFTSSTAVYAQSRGEWVDETSLTQPVRFNGKVMLEAEALTLSVSGGQVLRLGGLYGPGRDRLLRLVESGSPTVEVPPRFTNRIHVDDAARAAVHLLLSPVAATDLPVVLGVDDEPAAEHDVRDWLAGQLGVAPPPREERLADAPMNKRCRNLALRNSGFVFQYPSYREGYAQVLRERHEKT